MTLTFTTPRILGRRVFFETYNYAHCGKLHNVDNSRYDIDVWLLGRLHILISNEKGFYRDLHEARQHVEGDGL